MQVSIEETSNLGRKLTVIVPAEEIDKKTMGKLEQLKGEVKLKGFRPGKIPTDVMKQRFGKSARSEIIGEAIQRSYVDALTEQKLKPAGYPHIEPKVDPREADFGEPLEYTATFEVFPEFEIKALDDEKLEKQQSEVVDADVNEMLEKLRKQQAEWSEVDRAAQDGDQLEIDFTGTIKGEVFDGGSAKDFKFELGMGSMLDDFEKPLQGAKVGDKVNFKVKFPKDYSDEGVAGKKAEFEVTVHKVLESKLPELNDEFCAKLGVKEGGVKELTADLKKNMEQQLKQTIEQKFKADVFNKLIELNPIELPNALVDDEIQRLQKQMKQQYAQYTGAKADDLPDAPREEFEEEARRRVSLGLLISEFIKKHEIKADEKQVEEKLKQFSAGHEKPEEVINWIKQNKQYLSEIEAQVLEEMALVKLQEQLTINEKKVSFDELMNPKPAKE